MPQRPTFDAIRALPKDAGHRLAVYRTGWHLLLRDLKAQIVWDDIAAWIADLLALDEATGVDAIVAAYEELLADNPGPIRSKVLSW